MHITVMTLGEADPANTMLERYVGAELDYIEPIRRNFSSELTNVRTVGEAKKLADKHLLSLGAICDCAGLFRNPLGIMETDQLIRLYRMVLKYHDDFEDVLLFDAHV